MRMPPSPSGSATTAFVSMGTAASRWLTKRALHDHLGAFERALLAQVEIEGEVVALVGVHEHRARLERARAVDEGRQDLVVDDHRGRRIDSDIARLGHGHRDGVADELHLVGAKARARRLRLERQVGSLENRRRLRAASTPRVTSTDLMRACACGERTNTACRQPGGCTSSVYFPAPVTSRGSSRRLTTPCSAELTAMARNIGRHPILELA